MHRGGVPLDEAVQRTLFETARMGIAFETWKKLPETQHLLLAFQRKAEAAREECTELDLDRNPHELREAQKRVRLFKTLISEIDSVIRQGVQAEEQLKQPDYED